MFHKLLIFITWSVSPYTLIMECLLVVRNFRSFFKSVFPKNLLGLPPPPPLSLSFVQKKVWWASQCIRVPVCTWTPIQASCACRATRRLHSPLPPAWQVLTALCLSSSFSSNTCDAFRNWWSTTTSFCLERRPWQQEYIRTRVCNSRSFCYECCHGRIRSSSSLPTSVCTKKRKTFILERWTQRWTLYFDEHVHAKCRPSLKCQSKRWSFWRERACTCSALSA